MDLEANQPLGGRRILRGREDECMQLCGQTDADPRTS